MIGWLNDINRLVSKDKREPRVIPAENTHTLSPSSIRKVNAQPARVESSARETILFSFSCSKGRKEWLAMFLETLQIVAERTLLAMWGGEIPGEWASVWTKMHQWLRQVLLIVC